MHDSSYVLFIVIMLNNYAKIHLPNINFLCLTVVKVPYVKLV